MPLKSRPKLKVKFYDEAHLVDRGGFSLTWIKFILASLLIIVVFVGLGISLVWFTPLKKRLPGYLPPEERARIESSYLKVDSLQQLYTVHQAYLDNLVKLLDTKREPDIPDTVARALPMMPDSIMVSSEIELEFMKKMEEAGYIIAITKDYEENDSTTK